MNQDTLWRELRAKFEALHQERKKSTGNKRNGSMSMLTTGDTDDGGSRDGSGDGSRDGDEDGEESESLSSMSSLTSMST